ncbi:MAG: hypothetical protein KF762_07085 [Acidobacteria bacterium]|nr:hypothetical protein [Acidobacteriota bacterium]
MPTKSKTEITVETALERTKRVQAYVEELISTTGEHPECELKRSWLRNTPYLKAEFIKDVQSIANSEIPIEKEKYVVVGVDEVSREFVGVNHTDYDEASIRQLLESNLDAVPNYEILYLKNSNKDYVVMRIGHQTQKPFVATKDIKDGDKTHLRASEIWVKPNGSTGKRKVTSRNELISLIDVEARVREEVELRLGRILPEIRLEERARIGTTTFGAVPTFTSTDEEFVVYVEQIVAANESSRFNVLLEKLRERCLELWEKKLEDGDVLSVEEMTAIKAADFIPGMNRLALLGLTVIRYRADIKWFRSIADLLLEIFGLSKNLSRITPREIAAQKVESLNEHLSETVPGLESFLVANVLVGYEITIRKEVRYSTEFFPRVVKVKPHRDYGYEEYDSFFLFYPYYRSYDRRLDLLVSERFGSISSIVSLFRSEKLLSRSMLQVMCLNDWLSFLSFEKVGNDLKGGEPETIKYLEETYPTVGMSFYPVYVRESLSNVESFVNSVWGDLQDGKNNYFLLDPELAEILRGFDLKKRKELLVRFLIAMESEHSKVMLQQMRMPFAPHWSDEIETIKKEYKKQG